jgi:capsular polysaccharide biosynthesis protein
VKSPANAPLVRDYAQLLRNGWIVILCATVLSVGAGWLAWQTSDPVYRSTAKVFATTKGSATPVDAYYGHLNSVSRTLTIQSLARSPQVTMRTIDQLGLEETPGGLAGRIAVVVTNSALMDIIVTGSDPTVTRRTANAVAANLMQLTREIGGIDTSNVDLTLVDSGSAPERVGSMWQFMFHAGALGLALSVVLVLGYGLVRNKLLGKGHVDRIVGEAIAGRDA